MKLIHKTILTITILLLIALAMIIFIIIPTANDIKNTTDEIYTIRAGMEKKYDESLRSRLTKKKVEEIGLESSKYGSYLFNTKDALKLIQLLEMTATKNQINYKINDSNLDKITAGDKVEINLTVSGSYQAIFSYIYTIETLDYFLNVETIRILPTYNGGTVNNAEANLTLGLYVN